MAQDINVIALTGRLTDDAVLKQTSGGASVLNMKLANNRPKKKSGDSWVDQPPNYFTVIVWGRQAEVLSQYLVKGKMIAVSGRLQQRSYQLQDETRKRSVYEIVADTVELLSGSGGGRAGYSAQGGTQSQAQDMSQSAPRQGGTTSREDGTMYQEPSGQPPADPFEPEPEPDDEIPF